MLPAWSFQPGRAGGAPGMGTRRILIVGDHEPSRRLLRSQFALRGWQVETAASVLEGLASLEQPPDCLVLDLILPDGDGMDVLQRVRSQGLPTRVVVMTSL